jgi:hypothetical protein
MHDAEIGKRSDRVEGVTESRALAENPRVPDSIGRALRTRGGAVIGRAPGPLHGVAWVNRHRCGREAEAIVANCDRNRGRVCRTRVVSQKSGDNPHRYCNT